MILKIFLLVQLCFFSIASIAFPNVSVPHAWCQFSLKFWLKGNAKIIIFHVPATWLSVVAFLISSIYTIRYSRENITYANAQFGIIFCVLATVNGAMWARFARSSFNVNYIFLILTAAAVIGDSVNYLTGHLIGPKIFHNKKGRFLKIEYFERAHMFYEKYGGRTIIFARFIPIIKNFAPFVAGIGSMTYSKFIAYTFVGASAWVAMFVYGGYYLGNIGFIKHNFSIVIIAIIFIPMLPEIIKYLKHK
jgi:membrane-associated protein